MSCMQNATDAIVVDAPKHPLVNHTLRPDFAAVESVRTHVTDRSFCIRNYFTLRPWKGLQTRERRAGQMNPASEDRAKELELVQLL